MRRLTFIFVLILFPSTLGWCETIAIVVNKSNPIEDIELGTLTKIYNGQKRRWDNGEAIVAVNWPPSSQIRKSFYQLVLKSEPSKMFLRPGTPMRISYIIHKTSRSVKRFISHVEQSIGYINLSEVDDTVKVLRVNGIAPTVDNIRAGKYILQTSIITFNNFSNKIVLYELDHQ